MTSVADTRIASYLTLGISRPRIYFKGGSVKLHIGFRGAQRSISLIAVDWGTSNFRAFRLNARGAIVARCSSPRGILQVGDGNFAAALRAEVDPWLAEGETDVLMCGMIGSRQGWVEAGYLACPAGISDLAGAVTQVPFAEATVLLVPGVKGADAAGVPEVMRGEETAAMGMLPLAYGIGSGADMLRPMAIAVIGAVCISVLLSLVATPTVYYLLLQMRDAWSFRRVATDLPTTLD